MLAALAVLRVSIAITALATEGTKLPTIPAFDWRGFQGDASGYYAAAREAISSASSPPVAAVAALLVLLAAGLVGALQRRGAPTWTQLLSGLAGIAGAS